MRVLLMVAIAAAFVLGYGYYHATTHGWLHVSLTDTSLKSSDDGIRNAELRLLDADRKLLADAKADDKFGVVRLIHPEAGDCSKEEGKAAASSASRNQWQKCFETLSTWLIRWAGEVRVADVKFGTCDLKGVPVTLHKNREDWWLWWVPLPHIGGKPLTYFSLLIRVDGSTCTVARD